MPLCQPESLWLRHIPVFVLCIQVIYCVVRGYDTKLLLVTLLIVND